jgi:hypothetical protein
LLLLFRESVDAKYRSLKSGHIGAVGLDGMYLICTKLAPCRKILLTPFPPQSDDDSDIVYEGESEYFFHDSRYKIMQDDDLARLISFYNVFVRYEIPSCV